MGGVGGVGGGAREQWEQQPPTTLPFLFWEVWGVGQGGGREGEMGGDQTSVGDGVAAGGEGQLLFWGMKGEVVPGRKGVKWMADTRIRLMWGRGARESSAGLIWLVTRGVGGRRGGVGRGEYLDVIPKWPEPQCSHHYACACCRVGSSGYTLSLA